MGAVVRNSNGSGRKLVLALASIVLLGACVALTVHAERRRRRGNGIRDDEDSSSASSLARTNNEPPAAAEFIRMAFCGNSILYYNDCPRLLQQMVETAFPAVTVVQDSCLRGGANLHSLFERGNGMGTKFGPSYDIGQPTVSQLLQSESSGWHFVVINDHTQAPAREATAHKSQTALVDSYVPLLNGATPILIQTPAYRKRGINDSDDLGDFDTMTRLLREGLQSYLTVLSPNINARIAPVGEAYRLIRQRGNIDLWKRLYSWDDFHPSPYGTWLQACVIFCTMFGQPPPPYNAQWWERSRYMQPPDEMPLPLPTDEEARHLWYVACEVTGVVVP
jgi:hypothetical protein